MELLKNTLHHQRFVFVINLHKMEIEHCHGVERWMGYPDNHFSLFDYLKIIHPSHRFFHQISSQVGISGLMAGDYPIEFMKHRLITFIALQHKSGKYYSFKRVGSVFQYFVDQNKKHRLLEYINEFTMLGEYEETPGVITTFDENHVEKQWEEGMRREMKKVFEQESPFSLQEYRVLRHYAYNPKAQAADIATQFGVKISSINTYHKRLLGKAATLFSKQFDSVKDLALELRKQHFV